MDVEKQLAELKRKYFRKEISENEFKAEKAKLMK
jgi:hypothetical protein